MCDAGEATARSAGQQALGNDLLLEASCSESPLVTLSFSRYNWSMRQIDPFHVFDRRKKEFMF
jgi:hypothetical protein